MDKVLLVIPAFNEEKNIERVVEDLVRGFPYLDYVVVNDGSRDSTAKICRDKGYNLLDLPVNLGLAGCFQAGMKYAYRKGYRYAVQFDGDGQLTSAVDYVTNTKEYKAYYTAGHGETALSSSVTDLMEKSRISGQQKPALLLTAMPPGPEAAGPDSLLWKNGPKK